MADNFVNYSQMNAIVSKIGDRLNAVNGAYVFKGSIAFASLPSTITSIMVGYVYNINESFTTDARFVEGAGKVYSAGTNVGIIDVSTSSYDEVTPEAGDNPKEEGWYESNGSGGYVLTIDTEVQDGKIYYELVVTPAYAFDVLGNFVDVSAIENRITDTQEMIEADEFVASNDYSEGDIVRYQDALYRFKAGGHTAGDPWSLSEVNAVTVVGLIAEIGGGAGGLAIRLDKTQAAIAPIFNSANAYSIGDVVMYADELYEFKSAHIANDPWDATEVDKITVVSYVQALDSDTNDRIDSLFANIADEFDPTETYLIDDYVLYEEVLYKFKTNHSGAWVAADADAVDIATLIKNIEGDLADIDDRIDDVISNIADEFYATSDYSVGTLVIYQDKLYKFVSAHTANDPWDSSEVTAVTVEDVIDALATRVNNLRANVADTFDATVAYETGDVVLYGDTVYQFKTDHAAGAFNPSDVDAVTIETLIDAAEPDPLTTAQLNTLLALID